MPSNRDYRFDFIELPARSVDELQACRTFYSETFGWKFQDWGEDYVDTQDSGIGGGINADPEHRPSHPLAVIYVPDLERMVEQVRSAKCVITRDVFAFPSGRRFHFKDPAGNELAVWSDR